MSYVSSLLERWIGQENLFRSQKDLADQAKIQPSTLNGTLRAKIVQPETLGRLLSCLAESEQRQLVAAAIRDVIPEAYIGLVLKGDSITVEEEAMISTLTPLARETLSWLNKQASRDSEAQGWLEQLGRWVGIDKELEG